ncbi:hypothetical protein DFH07DRAFT_965621 [Mycena maculata]|uniref:Retrovirus-related Pol polyprotein from transposon TNT 1-94-like beta-barrel domain-containing protein n=1 Tax=Mycena maculata TaxID=230809 RepID=A0AAD7IE79_9AGAR|nr:hypothetical protein DFH07DRAFT_965621 [Mycena maculata]
MFPSLSSNNPFAPHWQDRQPQRYGPSPHTPENRQPAANTQMYHPQTYATQGQYPQPHPPHGYHPGVPVTQHPPVISYAPPPYPPPRDAYVPQFIPPPRHPAFAPPRMPPPPMVTPSYGTSYAHGAPQQPHAAPPASNLPASASEHVPAMGPIPKPFSLNTTAWTDAEKLSLKRDNWRAFESKVTNQLGMIAGAIRFLVLNPDDPNECPPQHLYPGHHRAWVDSNGIVLSFLREVLTVTERIHIADCTLASDTWTLLRYHHLVCGPAGQISAMKRFAAIQYASDPKTFASTTTRLTQCNEAIWHCGPPNPELFLLNGIISALEAKHRTTAKALLAVPNLTLQHAIATLDSMQGRAMEEEASGGGESQLHDQGLRPAHHPYMAILHQQRGGMAGKSVAEAKAKRRANEGKPPLPPRPTGTSAGKPQFKRDSGGWVYLTVEGVGDIYVAQPPPAPVANLALADAVGNLHTDPLPTEIEDRLEDLEAWLAVEDPRSSMNWNDPFVASATVSGDYDLFADTGANIHIPPFRADFTSFRAISPRAIKGFQGSSINATGIGMISTSRFELEWALYVPGASVRLLSVQRLSEVKNYTFHFNGRCYIHATSPVFSSTFR